MNATQQVLEQLLDKPVWTKEDCDWVLKYLQLSDTPELRQIMQERFSADLQANDGTPAVFSERMLQQIHQQIREDNKTQKPIRFINWKKVSAAAAIFTGLATGAYFFYTPSKPNRAFVKKEIQKEDIKAPNTSNAVLTLGNGRLIILDSAGKGTLATQGNVHVVKTSDGQIVYTGTSGELLFNTLTNPRGSKPVSLVLSDGSKVWLNSESSLRYPASFTEKERNVEITGEAYFEVAKNPGRPFKVNVDGSGTVEILGTHFNINSYRDEVSAKITLLEGSVKVFTPMSTGTNQHNSAIIAPGEQAQYNTGTIYTKEITVKSNVDVEAVVAWKNGFFNFDNTDLKTVLRQLSRWYNVEVIFTGNVPKRNFGGEMQRDLNLSEVLKLLEKNNVHFKIEGNKLFVMP